MDTKVAILGGGISGISAAYHLGLKNIESCIFEKRHAWGGLCDNFTIDGFRFDYFVHLSFSSNAYVKELFANSAAYNVHKPIPFNYYKGYWLRHPAQFNLASLPVTEKVKIIDSFVKRPQIEAPGNYREWLINGFGEYFAENFPLPYNKKYWTIAAEELTTDWVGKRMKEISLEQILGGAFEQKDENHYYANEMRYPKIGGYKSFLNTMAVNINIELNKHALLIDSKLKQIEFSDGSKTNFESLVSSLPLPELVKITKDIPIKIKEAAEKLMHTSGQLVSLGFKRPNVAKYLWFYIYDDDILPARAYSPSLKSADNVPANKSSLQFETYYSKKRPRQLIGDNLLEHIVKKGEKMNLFTANDIEIADYKEVNYANVVFDFEREKNVKIIRTYFEEKGIKTIGRFGEWDYFWSDQSLMSGKGVADEL